MRVSIAPELLGDVKFWQKLDGVILLFLEEQHVWEMDIELVESSPWYKAEKYGGGVTNAELVQKSWTSYFHRSDTCSRQQWCEVVEVPVTKEQIALADAGRWLIQPLLVFVENAKADKNFLRAVICVLNVPHLRDALDRGYIDFCHCGGITDILNQFDEKYQNARYRPRAVVFADSDSKLPGEPSDEARRLMEGCAVRGVDFKVTRKRAIENYVPECLLRRCVDDTAALGAYLSMTPQQRDHYSVKNGFASDLAGATRFKDPRLEDFYASVAPDARRILRAGLGQKIADQFEKCEDVLPKAALLEWCRSSGANELGQILAMLEGSL